MKSSGSERRKYYRIPTDQVISFAEANRSDKLALGRDVSRGGIRFRVVGCEIDQGQVLRVTFNVESQTVVAVGTVIWATDIDPLTVDVGLEFIEIDPLALTLLEEFTGDDFDWA